jgi:hypothetical protein
MGRHQQRLNWSPEADARIDEKLTDAYATDAVILAGKPSLEWLLEMRRIYRNIFERGADPDWQHDPKLREWYRKALADSDERWSKVQTLADEQLAEHRRRGTN